MPERSNDWLAQAKRDLENSRYELLGKFYEWACFSAQQAAEKALKQSFNEEALKPGGHSVANLLKALGTELPTGILSAAINLDKLYVPVRYPNGWAEGSPIPWRIDE